MVEPTRHERVKINKKTFESFFEECGSYFARDINTSASEVWTRVINNETGTEVFESIEKKDINRLKELYEEYYVHGISEGASSGKALSNDEYRQNKAKRNIFRIKPLYVHLKDGTEQDDIVVAEYIDKLYNRYKIPNEINIGKTWGWNFGENFVHFELMDYIYFLDIIQTILKEYNLDKTFFIGDGSGLLSCLLYNNFNIKKSTHVDLSHLLLRQYINNFNSDVDIKHHYAESFDEDLKHDTQILINQDSFPEMPLESMEKYIKNMDDNNVPFVLSYNIENGTEFNQHHIDYRKVILDSGYESVWRHNSTVRPPYVFELFYKGENND
jgi:hypothetical protein